MDSKIEKDINSKLEQIKHASGIANQRTQTSDNKLEHQLGYISVVQHTHDTEETFREKFIRKFRSNPLVPIGLCATTLALSAGLWSMRIGDKVKSQKMMRLRVLAQGFTVFALIGGVAYNSFNKQSEIIK